MPHSDAVDEALHINMPILPCADLFALELVILEQVSHPSSRAAQHCRRLRYRYMFSRFSHILSPIKRVMGPHTRSHKSSMRTRTPRQPHHS